jgi:hypothetical protein
MKRPDNFSKFLDFRKRFPVFSYDACDYFFTENSLDIKFSFSLLGKCSFHPGIIIPYKNDLFRPFAGLSASELDNLVFQAGMIELISYWKAACPPEVIIKPHGLSAEQVGFWKKIYFRGLGEFFYLNSIHAMEDDFMEITCEAENQVGPFPAVSTGGSLIPVGGGKDSAVTMGLLNKAGENWLPFAINPSNTTREVIHAAGKDREQTVEFHREIHPRLLKLNQEGFLNGHTPFSALLAFYSLLAAFLTGRREIILSNESSANEATVPGTSINHQYSKSFEFEKDFRDYVSTYISTGFKYFSLLRPLSELQIARLFSEMPGFFHHFKSCNIGSKTDSWCGACPKCLFTFIILSPFLKPSTLKEIFGKNLLDEPSLKDTYEQLSGRQENKPFECIGTVGEVNAAMDRAVDMYEKDNLPYLLRIHQQDRKVPRTSQNNFKQMLIHREPDHFVPEKYFNLLVKELR